MTEITIDPLHDREFVDLLQVVGLASELDTNHLHSVTNDLAETRIDVRRMDILERYYKANGDNRTASQRKRSDRLIVHNASDRVTARALIERMSALVPEVATTELQRIGGQDGPLVLRSGDNLSAITDDDIEMSEEGTLSVKSIVRAFNRLIAYTSLSFRFVPLVSDESREIYVALSKEGMLKMVHGGCVERLPMSSIDDFAAW